MIKYREHLFRAWDIQNERMVENPFVFEQNWDNKKQWIFYEDWTDHEDGVRRPGYIMVYTGLNDSNGVKIFEGDIVKIGSGSNSPIEFNDGGFGYYTHYEKQYSQFHSFSGHNWLKVILSEMKVIGNIFQNPELLK